MKKFEIWTENTKGGPIEHEYDVFQGDQVISINRSNSRQWSEHVRSEHVGCLKDDGNGVEIHIDDKKIKLDYSQLFALRCLIEVYNLDSGFKSEIRESTVIKQI